MTKVTRRDFVAGSAALAAGLSAARTWAADDAAAVVGIDSHVHFYDPTRPQGVPWPGKQDATLYKTQLPRDFLKAAESTCVKQCVVVEASPWYEDNRWLLDLAKSEPCIVGVVGRLTPGEAQFAPRLAELSTNATFRGIRIGQADVQKGITDAAVLDDLARLVDAGLTLDVNGGPALLAPLQELLVKLPRLRVVVNHLANPRNRGGEPPEGWERDLAAVAKHPQVFCKLSAFAEHTEPRPAPRELDHYRKFFDIAWRAFGESRLLYGSNWPVCLKAAELATTVQIAEAYLKEKGASAHRRVMRENALTAYGIK